MPGGRQHVRSVVLRLEQDILHPPALVVGRPDAGGERPLGQGVLDDDPTSGGSAGGMPSTQPLA
jgi:hypothetical protein